MPYPYSGRNLDDRGITCWVPLADVDERNGCDHYPWKVYVNQVTGERIVPPSRRGRA